LGKTTLLYRPFPGAPTHVSLEAPDVPVSATEDPSRFLRHYGPPSVLGEIR
jgi:hypothetical protein